MGEKMILKRVAIRFIPSLLAFPIGGEIASLVVGSIRTNTDAVFGGAIVGLVLGFIQYVALRPFNVNRLWIAYSGVGLTLGSLIAAMVTGLETESSSLALQGLIAGSFVGVAQALSQKRSVALIALWATSVGATWSTAWFITSKVIVDVEYGYAIFGSSGALVATTILTFVLPRAFSLSKKEIA